MQFNRRQFTLATATVAACACCGVSPDCARAGAEDPSGPVDVGTLADYRSDGAFDKFAKSHRIVMVRKSGRLYAATATCTHRDCVVKCVSDELRCPCHGSRYDLAGVVTKGPAKTPLPRYAISLNSAGRIIVDPSQRFEQKQWDDPKAFINI
jgi:Rieske Fe-S protein